MLPYFCGIRHLDKVYLDTTFVAQRFKHPTFPTKAKGLEELVRNVPKYPHDTIFHFHSWTLGYEDVWLALASALGSQVRSPFSGSQQKLMVTRSM